MLKQAVSGAALLLSIASTAQAGILLERVTLPGETLPQNYITKKCFVLDTGQMVKQYQLQGLVSKQVIPLQLSKATIKSAIDLAATGTITSKNIAVDGPTITYRAYRIGADGKLTAVMLYQENGGSGKEYNNNSFDAKILRNFIDQNCGD
ncbi:MAG: hypothetical protein ABL884_05435 [Methyloglobulus sp.]